MIEAEVVVSSIIQNILTSMASSPLSSSSQTLSNDEPEVQEFITSLLDDLLLEIIAPSGDEDDNISSYSDSLFSFPKDIDEESAAKDYDQQTFQVVPIEEIEEAEDEMRFYEEDSKSKLYPVKNSGQIIEQIGEVLQTVPSDTESQNLTLNRDHLPKRDDKSKINHETSEFGDAKSISPLKVSADSLVLNFKSYADAGPKRKHENDHEEVVYHTQLQVAMPKLLNAVPRLGLSKFRKLPKLHKTMKF